MVIIGFANDDDYWGVVSDSFWNLKFDWRLKFGLDFDNNRVSDDVPNDVSNDVYDGNHLEWYNYKKESMIIMLKILIKRTYFKEKNSP